MKKAIFLYLIIFIEGYVVLSSELLAIRQVMPYVGGGTDTTSIIIAAVLLPLAVGYYAGGKFKPKYNLLGKKITIRRKLLQNIFISTFFLVIGLSFIFVHDFFDFSFLYFGLSRLAITAIYSLIFLVFPVFLLAQTIPLASNFFRNETLSLATGKMLFFSTIGSLMGAIFSTLVLMATIGVNLTVTITILCLCVLYFLLSKKKISVPAIIILLLAGVSFHINSDYMMGRAGIIESNQYHTIQMSEYGNNNRLMTLNNAPAAGYNPNGELPFPYMQFIQKNFVQPLATQADKKSILVIGAGGFTLGLQDRKNDYVFIDIDGALKDVSEKYLLKQKLSPNKEFHALPARGYLQQTSKQNKKFDLIVIDTYLGLHIPEHLVTKEFFDTVKGSLNDNGVVAMNIIASPTFTNTFSVNIDNTIRSAFPNINREIVGRYNGWANNPKNARNIIYSYFHKSGNDKPNIYTDDKNRIYYDKTKPIE